MPETVDGYLVTAFGRYDDEVKYGLAFTSVVSVRLPDSIIAIEDENPFRSADSLTEIIVSENHPTLKTIDGVLFSKDGTQLLAYPTGRIVDLYRIPEGVETICDSAACFSQIGLLVCPSSLKTIEDGAFGSAQIPEFHFNDGLKTIGEWAFSVLQYQTPLAADGYFPGERAIKQTPPVVEWQLRQEALAVARKYTLTSTLPEFMYEDPKGLRPFSLQRKNNRKNCYAYNSIEWLSLLIYKHFEQQRFLKVRDIS